MKNLTKTRKLVYLALFAAITVILAVTPLGYIYINPVVTVTLMVVPVALGGLVLGWPAGFVLGMVFGLTSFIRAPLEPLGELLLSQSLILSVLACVLPRLVVGLLADLSSRLMRKNPKLRRIWYYALTGLVASLCNTVLFLGFIWLAFDTAVTGFTLGVILGVVGYNGVIEMAVNAVLVALLAKALLDVPRRPGQQPVGLVEEPMPPAPQPDEAQAPVDAPVAGEEAAQPGQQE